MPAKQRAQLSFLCYRFSALTLLLCSVFLLSALSWTLASVTDGYVVKVESATVYLDWGATSGVALGDQFEIYREGEELKHPVTGASLGRSESVLGQGVLESIQKKVSTGKLFQSKQDLKAGDRTRHKAAAPAAAQPTVVPAALGLASVMVPLLPKETWRSEPIKQEAMGLAVADVDGDGEKEVVVAYRDQLEVFRWNSTKLESVAVYQSRSYRNFLAVGTADLENVGHELIFASLFVEGNRRARTVVLELSSGALREVGRMDGFVRAMDRMDGRRDLVWQDLSMSRELRVRQPSLVVKKDQTFTNGPALKLPRALNDDQLFGYTWGDWDADGVEDFAFLQSGERLRTLFRDAKWSSREVYGGTKADFSWEGEQMGSLYPRLLSYRAEPGKSQLLVPHNIQASPIRLARLKIYKESELVSLAWNGLEMAPQWKLPVAGLLADFVVADAMGQGRSQLWIAAVGSGHKTILLSYWLP